MLTTAVGMGVSQAGGDLVLIPPKPEQYNEADTAAGKDSFAVENTAFALEYVGFWLKLEYADSRARFSESTSFGSIDCSEASRGHDLL
jgi:hypothetical protein